MKRVTDPAKLLMDRLLRLLRWRVWLAEKLQPTEWQVTLMWAALAGFMGALASLLFAACAEGVHQILTKSNAGVIESMRLLPWWARLGVPAAGGLLAGLVLMLGKRLFKGRSSTDYMEAIVIGDGNLPLRTSLVKITAALFTIGSGGSIGREGPMVQFAALLASLLGRWRKFSRQQLRLLVACGAAAGIASAYHAPIGGSFFVAEIILGTIAMESLGALVAASVAATLTMQVLGNADTLYAVPKFDLHTPLEMVPYVVLGLTAGALAPFFLRSLRLAESLFVETKLPLIARLTLGGLLVGAIAINVPEVCGNGYAVIVDILNGRIAWVALIGILCCKWLATASSVGSGAQGGVFTPTLFMGAAGGYLFGAGVGAVWPQAAIDPQAFALVGMGAFLSAASRAPVMAVIMLFEMTLSYEIILPLMLCSVVAYFTARGIDSHSLYGDALKRKQAEEPNTVLETGLVRDLIKADPPTVLPTARFAEIAQLFLKVRVNNIYVTTPEGRFVGAVSLHDIKPYLGEPGVAELVLAGDIMREDFPRLRPDQALGEALGQFLQTDVQRLPVVAPEGNLLGSISKNDLMLALVERKKPA
ncbi:MAG: ClcB-like voltage-gated chloride channel protein [Opitutaceae bacterium]|nr:ClcB-like voltage-gated chloride channel protein [Opitutaceae bacterium]